MRPLHLNLTGFVTYESLSLDLPSGAVAVLGPNGAGKSSLVDAIPLALFGPASGTLASYITDDGPDRCEIEITFEHAGETYRVRRGYSVRTKSGKPTLDLERLAASDFATSFVVEKTEVVYEPLSRETVAETQKAINRLLGLTRDTFTSSSFLAQGKANAFSTADPSDRKARLVEIVFGLDPVWPRRQALVRAKRQATDKAVIELNGRILGLEALAHGRELLATARQEAAAGVDLAEHKAKLADVAAEIAGAAVQQAQTRAAEKRAAESLHARCMQELAGQRQILDRAESARIVAVDTKHIIEQTEPVARGLEAAEKALADVRSAMERYKAEAEARKSKRAEAERRTTALEGRARHRDQLVEKSETLDAQAIALEESDHATCDRCGQTLGSALGNAVGSMRKESASYRNAAALVSQEIAEETAEISMLIVARDQPISVAVPETEEINELVRAYHRCRDAAADLAALRERLATAERTQAEATVTVHAEVARLTQALSEAEKALDAYADDEPVNVSALEARAAQTRMEARQAREALDAARAQLVKCETALEQAEKARQELDDARAEQKELRAELDLLVPLEKAFGPDGVPVLLVEKQAIPAIEAEANRVLRMLGGKTADAAIQLETQRELKNGNTADALDIVVVTGHGTRRPYERWSGGEKSRLDLAISAGLVKVLPRSDLFVIDEPDGLDRQGKQALVELLREALAGGVELAYLISHDPELQDSFDTVIRVEDLIAQSPVRVSVPARTTP